MTDAIEKEILTVFRHTLIHMAKDAGLKPRQIAEVFGLNKSTVTRALKKKPIDISTLRKFVV